MAYDDVFGTVEFVATVGLVPWREPSDYVQSITGRALSVDGDQVGLISLQLVSSTVAENHGQDLLHVCDAESGLLADIHTKLMQLEDEGQQELDIVPGWSNLLLIEDVEATAEMEGTPISVPLIETAVSMFCPAGLVVAVEDSLELTVEEWRQLGFRRIAQSPYVYRDQMRLNPYRQSPFEPNDDPSYTCDACGEEIVIPVDVSQGAYQRYVEDCPVCCRANVIFVEIDEDGNVTVRAEPEE